MSEEVIYSDNNVSISTSRIVIGATTYALRNITSVKMTMTPAKRGCAIMLIVFGAFCLVAGVAGWLASAPGQNGFLAAVGGLFWAAIIGGGGILWVRFSKNSFNVLIASSSGEAKAMTSKDKAYIEKIVGSINDAIIRYR